MGLVTVTLNQVYVPFPSISHSVSPADGLCRKISHFHSGTKSSVYSPLIIIFQVTSEYQTLITLSEGTLLNGHKTPLSNKDTFQQNKQTNPSYNASPCIFISS